jgi:hypothetical protein
MYIFHCLGSRACNVQQMDWLTVRQTFWSHAARQTVLRPRVGRHQLRIVLKKRCNIYIYTHTVVNYWLFDMFLHLILFDGIWMYLREILSNTTNMNPFESIWLMCAHTEPRRIPCELPTSGGSQKMQLMQLLGVRSVRALQQKQWLSLAKTCFNLDVFRICRSELKRRRYLGLVPSSKGHPSKPAAMKTSSIVACASEFDASHIFTILHIIYHHFTSKTHGIRSTTWEDERDKLKFSARIRLRFTVVFWFVAIYCNTFIYITLWS